MISGSVPDLFKTLVMCYQYSIYTIMALDLQFLLCGFNSQSGAAVQ